MDPNEKAENVPGESEEVKKKKKRRKKNKNKQQGENQQEEEKKEQVTQKPEQKQQEQQNPKKEKKQPKQEPQQQAKKTKKKKKQEDDDDLDKFMEEFKKQAETEVQKNKNEETKTASSAALESSELLFQKRMGQILPLTPEQQSSAALEQPLDNSNLPALGSWKAESLGKQTFPPTLRVAELYKDKNTLPIGEIQYYTGSQQWRQNSQEMKEKELLYDDQIKCLREAAEVHRTLRKYAQSFIKPGLKLIDICERIESMSRYLISAKGIESGIAFPTGVSRNHIAAHYTSNPMDVTILEPTDVLKVDLGCQIHGRIIDCAFTVCFDPVYQSLLEASREGTNAGIKCSGIDARFNEIGEQIQEVIESYEVDLQGKTYQVKPVRNLNGHSIGDYTIHGGKSVPICKGGPQTKMEEGELYAIETFASTGKGYVVEDLECSHYMRNAMAKPTGFRHPKAKQLLNAIDQNFSTLAFCRRYLDEIGQTSHILALKSLVDSNYLNPYPPLCDISGSYVSQFEHTFLLKPTSKEVFSRGDDY
eukprot:TRINITY_DN1721_c0_g3_i1.p1 TRINITY_DN1721_c0_g3~~TRINITY_DN1721_c0_g3_i1.p1  ORF type:complete len:533 (-),score=88.91 TRINITY_DN1721_c0_g3_i1:151-1749(-)